MEAYYKGLWSLLPFTAQMSLTIVLGTALAATPWFGRLVAALSRVPSTAAQMIALAVGLTAVASYAFWAFGYALSPLIGVHFAREAERKGIPIHFPFFLATIFASIAVWQFGLSASAPLLVATPGHFLESVIGVIPLGRTIGSPASILHVAAYLCAVIAAGCLLMPKTPSPLSDYPSAAQLIDPPAAVSTDAVTWSERLETRPYFLRILCVFLGGWLWFHFGAKALGANVNSMNVTLFFLVFLLYGSVRSINKAFENAALSAWPILILYPLYAGLAGLIEFTHIGASIAAFVAASSNALTFPALSAAIGTVFAFFIPSSGGQWAIQGLVTAKASMAVGVSVERGLLSMSIGDHMGNLTSPFWYVVVAGMVRIDFRKFFGYGLVYAAIWFIIGVIVFTFAPC